MNRSRSVCVLLTAALGFLFGCSSPRLESHVERHVLRVDAVGEVLDVRTGRAADRRSTIQLICDDAMAFVRAHRATTPEEPVPRLLVYVHGGRGSPQSKLADADRAIADILRETKNPQNGYAPTYPIAITWPSSEFGSYWQHMTRLRYGRTRKWLGALTSPFYLVSDLAHGIVMLPRSFTYKVTDDLAVGAKYVTGRSLTKEMRLVDRVEEAAPELSASDYRLQIGEYHPTTARQLYRGTMYLVSFAPKIVSQAVIEGLGEGMWHAMLHRVSNLMRPVVDVESAASTRVVVDQLRERPDGPVIELFRALARELEREPKPKPVSAADLAAGAASCDASRDLFLPGPDGPIRFEIVLVGHSMGAIAVDRLLDELEIIELEDRGGVPTRGWNLPISELVYMAPASSVRESAASVIPFLQYRNGVDASAGSTPTSELATHLRVLTLHPLAEVSEANFDLFAPRGSLLEWIDLFFTDPPTPLDRRLGKWSNLAPALYAFEPVRNAMSVKVFGVHGRSIPCKHGEFNQGPFWRDEYWDVRGPTAYMPHTVDGHRAWIPIESPKSPLPLN